MYTKLLCNGVTHTEVIGLCVTLWIAHWPVNSGRVQREFLIPGILVRISLIFPLHLEKSFSRSHLKTRDW